MPKEFRTLIPLEEARFLVLSRPPRPDLEEVSLDSALGRVLGERIVADLDVPGFDRASMDGLAVSARDTLEAREDRPVRLHLVGRVPMGIGPDLEVPRGGAAEVSTGSMMPSGADGVVMIEHAELEGDTVLIRRPVHQGENVLLAGSDIAFGEAVLLPGAVITPREVGVLAALGRERVRVRRLRVGIASTGDELVEPGRTLGPGEVYDINSYAIAAAAKESGASPLLFGILPDDREAMAQSLLGMARECSMILVSGSTSAGAGDVIYRVLDEVGETIFHGINLRPGRPTLFGTVSGRPFLGLPGYPTSALTVFGLLAAPAIRRALGLRRGGHRVAGRMARPVRSDGRRQMISVEVAGDLVYPVDKGSGSITTLSEADGVVEIPQEVEYLERGEAVEVQLFGELHPPDLILAGEDSAALEDIAEHLGLEVRLLFIGSARGIIALKDGVADIAVVSGPQEPCEGTVLLKGYRRELGLMAREAKGLEHKRIMGWPRGSEMSRIFEALLQEAGVKAKYSRLGRTHSSVAASIAAGLADLGFGEKAAAEKAGLCFEHRAWEEVNFLVKASRMESPAVRAFLDAARETVP
jgi:putative molybdopterin biosynthesis protein